MRAFPRPETVSPNMGGPSRAGSTRSNVAHETPPLVTPGRVQSSPRPHAVTPSREEDPFDVFKAPNSKNRQTNSSPFEMEYDKSAGNPFVQEEEMPMDEALDRGVQTKLVVREEEETRHAVPKEKVASPKVISPRVVSSATKTTRFTKSSPKMERARQRMRQTLGLSAVDAADRGGGVGHINARPSPDAKRNDPSVVKPSQASQQPSAVQRSQLSPDEQAMWDEIQEKIETVQSQSSGKCRVLQREIENSTAQLDQARRHEQELEGKLDEARGQLETLKTRQPHDSPTTTNDELQARCLEEKIAKTESLYKEAHEMTTAQETQHENTVRAIDRVLADVTKEKDAAVELLQNELELLEGQWQTQMGGDELMPSRANLKNLASLNKEVGDVKSQVGANSKGTVVPVELKVIKREIVELKAKESKMRSVIDIKEKQILKLKRYLRAIESGQDISYSQSNADVEEIEVLKKQVDEKEISLENAKKIILSLEMANESLVTSGRDKSKEKDERIFMLEAEASDRQKLLDSLAVELREVQIRKNELEGNVKLQAVQHKVLAEQLSMSLSELQAASVVHEAMLSSGTVDDATLDKISSVLNKTLVALRVANSDAVRGDLLDSDHISDILSDVGSVSSDLNRQLDAIIQKDRESAAHGLRHKVEEKTVTVQRLEAALTASAMEIQKQYLKLKKIEAEREEQEAKLNGEVMELKNQLSTNMEVLNKKQLAVEVLRGSLEIKDDDGYHAGDDNAEDDGETQRAGTLTSSSKYDRAAKTKALATLLDNSRGSAVSVASTVTMQELARCRSELVQANDEKERNAKELQIEKDNLANAKLIISSLERANKNMIEDLRQRLNDSNTAIASLLDQTSKYEKSSSALKEEVEKLKKEKAQQARDHMVEVEKLKDSGVVTKLRLAAKEREIKERERKENQGAEEDTTMVITDDDSVTGDMEDKYIVGTEDLNSQDGEEEEVEVSLRV